MSLVSELLATRSPRRLPAAFVPKSMRRMYDGAQMRQVIRDGMKNRRRRRFCPTYHAVAILIDDGDRDDLDDAIPVCPWTDLGGDHG